MREKDIRKGLILVKPGAIGSRTRIEPPLVQVLELVREATRHLHEAVDCLSQAVQLELEAKEKRALGRRAGAGSRRSGACKP